VEENMEKKETQMDVMIQETRQYIMDNLAITSMSNEELEDKIEELIFEKTKDGFFSIEEKVQIVQEIYGSIRGFGILDSILSDDNVTEVMDRTIFLLRRMEL
jgi:pilus assembly protein CpaF